MEQNSPNDTINQPTVPGTTMPVSTGSAIETKPAELAADDMTGDRTVKMRSLLIKLLLGCLVAAASVAVVAVLAGSMTEIVWRAIGTIVSAMIHIGILFAVVSITASGNKKMQISTNFVVNASIIIIVCSFFTSMFSTWNVLGAEWSVKLYITYAVLLFLLLHAKTIMDVEAVYEKVRPYMYANFVFMMLVGALILGVVYVDGGWDLLDGFYGRLLGASVIIDVTLSMVIAVMHRLYLQSHPEIAEAQQVRHGGSAGRIIVGILLFIFVIWPLMSVMLAIARW